MNDTTGKNPWLLPDGIDEVLPNEAREAEVLRRRLLDLYQSWGYDLVIPPTIEFTDSLLTGSGVDLDLQTFKMTDRISGKTLGIRADITPQIARMDAHSLKRQGVSRLCYAGTVLRTAASNPLESRSPIQIGVELYGEKNIKADIEVISLMLASLDSSGLSGITLDLGHVAVLGSLIGDQDLTDGQKHQLATLYRSKARAELDNWLGSNISDKALSSKLLDLAGCSGGIEVLEEASKLFAGYSGVTDALAELALVADTVMQRYPSIDLNFDLSENPGFAYHTGMVFAAYVPGCGRMVANGGRYDAIGSSFGRSRAATGFNADLKTLIQLGARVSEPHKGILVIDQGDTDQWSTVCQLRQAGERVVCIFSADSNSLEFDCDRQLVLEAGEWVVKPL